MARITGGSLKGRIVDDAVADGIRPTTDRAREALFSILGQDLSGVRWLDAFGGTGLIGIEARSRGADVVIIERSPRATKGIAERIAKLGIDGIALRRADALAIAGDLGRFDVVFADPPWADPIPPALAALAPITDDWLVLEAETGGDVPDVAGDLRRERVRSYGRTSFHMFRRS